MNLKSQRNVFYKDTYLYFNIDYIELHIHTHLHHTYTLKISAHTHTHNQCENLSDLLIAMEGI